MENNYSEVEEIENGQFKKVYKAKNIKTSELAVITKIQKIQEKEYTTFFNQEAEAMRKCECEYSIKLKYYNEKKSDNYIFITEDYDTDLKKLLTSRKNNNQKGLSIEELQKMLLQLNSAFKKMIENKIIHRDLRANDICIKYTDESKTNFISKLGDYGFAKQALNLFSTTFYGTYYNKAPEIYHQQKFDNKVDLWSIGIIIYYSYFLKYPYKASNETMLFEKIDKNEDYERPENNVLRDLINKLLVVDPEKRMTWDEYFEHQFFKYVIIKDFITGINNDNFKCYIAKKISNNENNNKVLIKSYNKEFYENNKEQFTYSEKLKEKLNNSKNVLKLIDIYEENDTKNFVYELNDNSEYDLEYDCESLAEYSKKNIFTEKDLQIITNDLYNNIFSLLNDDHLLFLSVYSFLFTKNKTLILYDFGVNKNLLTKDEMMLYYSSNKNEIDCPEINIKTNIMNYGITLLQLLNQNKIVEEKELYNILDSKLSKNFVNFLKKCTAQNIDERYTWKNFETDNFFNNTNDNKMDDNQLLLDNDKLEFILNNLITKFRTVNNYYSNLEIKYDLPFFEENKYLLLIMIFEIKIISNILSNENVLSSNKSEISFLNIQSQKLFTFNLNFDQIDKNKSNKLVENFIVETKNILKNLLEIIPLFYNFKKTTEVNNGVVNFNLSIKNLISNFNNMYFIEFFLDNFKKFSMLCKDKNFEFAYEKICFIQYICEIIIFIGKSMEVCDEEKKYEEEGLSEIDFGNKYIIISFLKSIYISSNNSISSNQNLFKNLNVYIDELVNFYPKIIEWKEKLKK